jgi:hypothetical protein
MKTINIPYIAAIFGLILLVTVMFGSHTNANGVTALPLLTLLIFNECAFFLTAAGSFIGIKHILATGFKAFYSATTLLCILLSIQFILLGIKLWPL